MKEIIFITKQGSKIRRKDNQIVVYLSDEKISGFPINRIDKLFLIGNIEISMPAINFLLSRNVDIYLLSQTGKFKGLISSTNLRSNYDLRLKQYRAFYTSKKNLQIAKFFVLKKIQEIQKFIEIDLSNLIDMLNNTSNYNEILGIEGKATALFFEKLKDFIKNKNLGFKKREYNPSLDPVNALLSFTYSLFYGLLFSIISSKGYDPYIGFLHRKRGTHAAFVSDVMEPFRVELSKFVAVLFNKEVITEDDFVPDVKGIYLKNNSLKKFLKIFNENYIEKNSYKPKTEKILSEIEKIL
ncbi:CRISPR-associated endonuclease Cas1 [Persephonella sp.]